MKFYEFGDKSLPNVMLIHGAGWSYWLYLREARLLQEKYHIILPVLDGHGEESETLYSSTEEVADKIIAYIDENCGGKLFAISGVSLGGQITIDILSKRKDIAKKAIIESGMCIPSPLIHKYSKITTKLFGKLMFSKKFSKWALTKLPKDWKLPEEIEKLYMRDMIKIKQKTMYSIFDSYYLYSLKDSLKECSADTIYWYGSKEMNCIKKSSRLFQSYVKKCEVIELEKYIHAEISTYHPEEWVKRAEEFFEKE